MPKKIKIPKYVKAVVKEALEKRQNQPKSKQAGLTKSEAQKLGIQSGVERAKQLLRNDYITEKDIKSMIAFYDRFKNRSTPKIEEAIRLWGGRSFLRFLKKIYN